MEKRRGPTRYTLLRPCLEPACVPSGSLSTLSPYSRKPSLFGPNMSICAKGVSRGVHNIAFLLSPDRFRAFDLFLFFCMANKLEQVVDLYKRYHMPIVQHAELPLDGGPHDGSPPGLRHID